jgi:hypothetical protein
MADSSAHASTVMPTQAGIHDYAACGNRKSWMPTPANSPGQACVGMTVRTWMRTSFFSAPGISCTEIEASALSR